jgi:anti-sigma regulatory factor (Ser/Thr protein kinase)
MTTADVTYREVSLRLSCDPSSARRGRTLVRRVIANWDTGMTSAQLDVLQLLTSELITNCIVHACGACHDLTAVDDPLGVRVSVTDDDIDRPLSLPEKHPGVLGGGGLALIQTYADDWGVDELPAGRVIWFRLNVINPAPPRPRVMPEQRRRLWPF